MDKNEALEFLRQHQPMPPDEEISTETLEIYKDVRRYFVANPSMEAVPLFLQSFGEGSGFGIYQLVSEVLKDLPSAEIIPYLVTALNSESSSIRHWNADIAVDLPSPELIEPLSRLLEIGDWDERDATVTALSRIRSNKSLEALLSALESEPDEYIASCMRDAISELQDN